MVDRSILFSPYRLNDTLTLNNRIVMAPLTRCMAAEGLVPTAEMAAYYARRADAGLIISEATIIRPDGQGHPNVPGIFTAAQIAGWQQVTERVHDAGGKMFLQLWHTGRVAHSFYSGLPPVAPSAIAYDATVPRQRELHYEQPKALSIEDIQQLLRDYAQAAKNAIKAGFDGVEIHGANGYLIDQFLHHDTNQRDDQYGGSADNMGRFALEVVDAVIEAIGAERTAIRLTPGAYTNMAADARDRAVFDALLPKLSDRKLAYLHLGIFDDSLTFDFLGGRASRYLRQHYQGTFIGVGGLDADTAATDIAAGHIDLAAIGRPFIANPDYVNKVREGKAITPYDPNMLSTLN